MVFIDTHTHCTDEAFPGAEQDLFVERALAAGVSRMLLADIDTHERDAMYAAVEGIPACSTPCWGCTRGR